MKKFILIILGLIFITTFISCKTKNYGKTEYYISGIYLEIEEDPSFVTDIFCVNPLMYYDYNTKTLCTRRGLYGTLEFSNISKNITENDNEIIYTFNLTILIPNVFNQKIKIYHIVQNETKIWVDNSVYEEIDLNSSGKFNSQIKYNYQNQNYRFIFTLDYIRKGV